MPTDEQRALWAAIRAQPDDDTPRLVYADWLQENGDEARAEFIRLQCQIAQLPADRRTQRKVLPALEHRERVLCMTNRARWVEPLFRAIARPGPGVNLEAWFRTTVVQFHRGFLVGLRLDLDGAHRLVTAGVDLEPLQNVLVTQGWVKYNPKKLAEVFAWDGVGCIAQFTLEGATDDCVGSITAGPSARLLRLTLHSGEITDAGASFLAEWPSAATLTFLSLSGNRIGDRGAEALAASPHLDGIAELRLERNPISREARRRLVLRFGGNVFLDPEPV